MRERVGRDTVDRDAEKAEKGQFPEGKLENGPPAPLGSDACVTVSAALR